MANHFNHPRTKARTFEYARLDQATLKKHKTTPVNCGINLQWSKNGYITLQLEATRKENSLFIHTTPTEGYHVYLEETQLTYGKRVWYLCPSCGGRCAILYHAQRFACRKCVKPTYESQNGSKIHNLMDRIKAKRKRLWPEMPDYFRDDILDSCEWFPKPKGMHKARFERERTKILNLEDSFMFHAQNIVDALDF